MERMERSVGESPPRVATATKLVDGKVRSCGKRFFSIFDEEGRKVGTGGD